MRELTEQLLRRHAEGRPYAVATVIGVTGSAPRPPGAAMAVDADGVAIGSISGGCLEAAIYELCRDALRTGRPCRESFGYNDSDPFAIGSTCGGVLEVFIHPIYPSGPAAGNGTVEAGGVVEGDVIAMALRAREPVALVRDMGTGAAMALGPDWVAGARFDAAVVAEVRAMLDLGAIGVRTIGCGGAEVTVFVECSVPPPRMIVFGANDVAAAMARIGTFLGYRVTVCDARPVFATKARFPAADEVVVEWPHRYLERTEVDSRTVICVLTHDAKFDVPILRTALRRNVSYVGAMGSRRTHADRLSRLRAAGLTDLELSRLHSPIGLDLGGRTPEETAVAVAAEIVAVRRGGSGRALTVTDGPIHAYDGVPPMESAGQRGPGSYVCAT